MGLSKPDLLAFLKRAGEASAEDVASAFGVRYAVAAMGLLRLVRQDLAERFRHEARGMYRYRITARGLDRLSYFQEHPPSVAGG